MQKLALQKQDSLTTLALQCQSLQEVDLSECESLTNSICDVFSDGGGCPMLKSLVLDNCEVHEQIIFLAFPGFTFHNTRAMLVVYSYKSNGCFRTFDCLFCNFNCFHKLYNQLI
jgi:hypothetical protein